MAWFEQLSDSSLFNWVILPALIFCLRICDVSFGTLRIIFVSRSNRLIAPLLGIFEVSIWVFAINQVMQNLNNVACFLAYALGFATGNYIGILIEEKLAIGTLIIRVFLVNDDTEMRTRLQDAGFGVTTIDAHGKNGNVKILYIVIKRKNLPDATEIIEACQANAFYSIEEAKAVSQGIFPSEKKKSFSGLKYHYRKPGK